MPGSPGMRTMARDAALAACQARVGARLGDGWTLEALIGVGRTTAVYRATSNAGGESAVKVLHPHLASHLDLRARFLRDAYLANKIEHVGSVKVLADGLDEEWGAYLVLELLRGASVVSHARPHAGRLPVKLVLRVLDQLLGLLEKAHSAGILHREIKPEHVFLTDDGTVKLLDFGIARLAEGVAISPTAPEPLVGDPAFMAPEQAMGHADEVDARTDIWAVGATAFALLTGKDVHAGVAPLEGAEAAATRRAPSLGAVVEAPVALVELVDTALAFEREHRYPSATVMRRALRGAATELQTLRSSIRPGPHRASSLAPEVRGYVLASASSAGMRGAPESQHSSTLVSQGPAGTVASPERPGTVVSSQGPTGTVAARERPGTLVSQTDLGAAAPLDSPGKPVSRQAKSPESGAEPAGPPRVASPTHGEEELEALRNLFAEFECVLRTQHRFSRHHAEASEPFRLLFGALDALLARCRGLLAWQVTPTSFVAGDVTLWQPAVPFDRVVSQLYAEGVRALGIGPGITGGELGELLALIAADRATEMDPEDDHVTLLWDASLPHVGWSSIDGLGAPGEGERVELEAAAERVVQLARFDTGQQLEEQWAEGRARQASQPIAPLLQRLAPWVEDGTRAEGGSFAGRGQVEQGDAERCTLGASQRASTAEVAATELLQSRLRPSLETLGHDFAVAMVYALRAVTVGGKADALVRALRFWIEELAAAAPARALDLVSALLGAAAGMDGSAEAGEAGSVLVSSVLSSDLLALVLKGVLASGASEDHWLEKLRALLEGADDSLVDSVLESFASATSGGVKRELLDYLRRVAQGHEEAIGRQFVSIDVASGLALVRLLAKVGSGEARAALDLATQSPHAVVRIEALTHLEGGVGERLRSELRALLDDESPAKRMEALSSIAEHGLRAAGPTLVLRVRGEEFDRLSLDERRAMLHAVSVLAPSRAESLALELLKEGRVMTSEVHEQTRGLAAEVLGRVATSREALDALHDAATKRWRNSERVRSAAGEALREAERRQSLAPEPAPSELVIVPPSEAHATGPSGRDGGVDGYLSWGRAFQRAEGWPSGDPAGEAPAGDAGGRGEVDADAPVEERVLRFYAVALVTLRRFYDTVASGADPAPVYVKRLAQRLVSLSETGAAALLGMGALASVHRDDAGRALQVSIHALLAGRVLTRDRNLLSQLAMAALLVDLGHVRLAGGAPGPEQPPHPLRPASVGLVPGLTAAVCLGGAGAGAANALRTTVAFETAWLESPPPQKLWPFAERAPHPQSQLLCAVRRYLDLRAPRDHGAAPLSPLAALVQLAAERNTDDTILRALVRALGHPPAGTVVELCTGEWGVAVGPTGPEVEPPRCRVRLVTDSAGRALSPCPEVDCATHSDGCTTPSDASQAPSLCGVVDTALARFNVARAFAFAPRSRA